MSLDDLNREQKRHLKRTGALDLVRALEGAPAAEPFVPGMVEIPPSLQREIGDKGWVNGVR
jgi:hypothetical protein